MVFHYDYARPHTAEFIDAYLATNQMTRVPYSAFSFDLAPSDFYVFGKLKAVLKGSSFEDENEFLCDMIEVLSDIFLQELEAVSEEWLIRLD
jgi:hypothetical protein